MTITCYKGPITFHKERKADKVWWVDRNDGSVGVHEFTFDKKKIYNLFADYRDLPPDKKAIFDKENPFWRDFFNKD